MKFRKIFTRQDLSLRFVGSVAYAAVLVGASKTIQGTVYLGSTVRAAARNRPARIG
jgi:hypothetical protein